MPLDVCEKGCVRSFVGEKERGGEGKKVEREEVREGLRT